MKGASIILAPPPPPGGGVQKGVPEGLLRGRQLRKPMGMAAETPNWGGRKRLPRGPPLMVMVVETQN